MLLMVAVPSVQATHNDGTGTDGTGFSASGGCNGDNDVAGTGVDGFPSAEADVGTDANGDVDLLDVVDAVNAAGNLAEGQTNNPGTNACQDSPSWLGLHACDDVATSGTCVWVFCYDGSAHVADPGSPGECQDHD